MLQIKVRPSKSATDLAANYWKTVIRHRSVADQEKYLRSAEGISRFGAKRCNQLLKDLKRLRDHSAAAVPSAAWLDSILRRGGETFPPPVEPGETPTGIQRGMVLSREMIRIGNGPPSRRWTPAPCCDLEDALDAMNEGEALRHHVEWPAPSPSAVAICRIREIQAHEHRTTLTLGRLRYQRDGTPYPDC
jgi:hypothetical protein